MAQRVKFFLAADNGSFAHFGLDMHFTEAAPFACAAAIQAQPGTISVDASGPIRKPAGLAGREPFPSEGAA